MDKQIVQYDFEYYHRAIEKVYKDYYRKNMISLFVLLTVECAVLFVSGWSVFGILVLVALIAGVGLTANASKKFPEFLEKESQLSELSLFSEDKTNYYIEKEKLKFAKKYTRNLPSQERGITFFIGVQPFNVKKPVYVRYYDSLDITYTEKYKQNKNNVSFTKSRWKYRFSSWLKILPGLLLFIYIFFFRLSFIWEPIKNLLSSLF